LQKIKKVLLFYKYCIILATSIFFWVMTKQDKYTPLLLLMLKSNESILYWYISIIIRLILIKHRQIVSFGCYCDSHYKSYVVESDIFELGKNKFDRAGHSPSCWWMEGGLPGK